MTIEELTPTHPERIKWAAETLACLVKQTAEQYCNAKDNWDPTGGPFNEGRYKKDLHDFAYENNLSFPVYLLLKYTWNDVLDWSDDPTSYVGSSDDGKLKKEVNKDHEKVQLPTPKRHPKKSSTGETER